MKNKFWSALGVSMFLACAAATAQPAEPPGGGPGGGFGPGHGGPREFMLGDRMAERLGLEQAQRDEIRAIVQAGREEHKALRNELKASQELLREATQFDAYDATAVSVLAGGMGAVNARQVELRARTRQQALGVLTAEQRTQLDGLRSQRDERRKNAGNRGCGEGSSGKRHKRRG